MSKISVIARTGLKVPREDNPRKYIDDKTPLDVEHSAYYRRRLREGDLVRVTESERVAPKPAAAAPAVTASEPAAKATDSTSDKAAS